MTTTQNTQTVKNAAITVKLSLKLFLKTLKIEIDAIFKDI